MVIGTMVEAARTKAEEKEEGNTASEVMCSTLSTVELRQLVLRVVMDAYRCFGNSNYAISLHSWLWVVVLWLKSTIF